MALATVKATLPKTDDTAFMIPGLQAKPFTEEEINTAWEMMDLDGHGRLQMQDLRRTLELCGEEQATDSELAEMIRLLDTDGSGTVQFQEFFRAFTNPPAVFRNFDLHRRSTEVDGDDAGPTSPKPPDTPSGSGSSISARR